MELIFNYTVSNIVRQLTVSKKFIKVFVYTLQRLTPKIS